MADAYMTYNYNSHVLREFRIRSQLIFEICSYCPLAQCFFLLQLLNGVRIKSKSDGNMNQKEWNISAVLRKFEWRF